MEPQRKGSNFYQLTAQVLNDKNLNHAEKLTMAILNGLSDEDGKCWPSNEWLCEKLDITERPLRYILENLEKNNYIKREVISWENNPFKKYRIIYVCNNFKLSLPEAENSPLGDAENSRTEGLKTAGIIDKKELLIDKKEEPPPKSADFSPPSKRKLAPEVHNEVAPRVFITNSQEQSLKKRLEGLSIDLKDCYLKLSDWKIGKQIEGGKNDYKAIVDWVISALKVETVKKTDNRTEKDQEFAKEIDKKLPLKIKNGEITIGYNYIEFSFGMRGIEKIMFGDSGFKENCINCLRRMNIHWNDI